MSLMFGMTALPLLVLVLVLVLVLSEISLVAVAVPNALDPGTRDPVVVASGLGGSLLLGTPRSLKAFDETPCKLLNETSREEEYLHASSENLRRANATLRIGMAVTLKGAWEPISQDWCRLALLWLNLVREKGGIEARNGKVFAVHIDVLDVSVSSELGVDQLNLRETESASYNGVKHLVQDMGSHVVTSPYTSTLTPYAALAAAELGTPILAAGAAAESTYVCPTACDNATHCDSLLFGCSMPKRRRFETLYGTLTPASKYFRDYVSLVGSIHGAKTVAFVLEDNEFARAIIAGARDQAENVAGMRVVAEVYLAASVYAENPPLDAMSADKFPHTPGESSAIKVKFTGKSFEDAAAPFVERMKQLDVDLVVGGTYLESCISLVRAFKQANWLPKALGLSSCMGMPRMYDALGMDLRWVSGPSQWDYRLRGSDYDETDDVVPNYFRRLKSGDPFSPETFSETFKAAYSQNASYQGVSMMAAMYMLEGALVSAGSVENADLNEALSNYQSPSFWGINTVDSFGKNNRRTSVTWSYAGDGSLQVVSPVNAATEDIVYPLPPWDSNRRNYQCSPGTHVIGTNRWNVNQTEFFRTGHSSWNGTSCRPCSTGTYADEHGMLECKPCPLNTFGSANGLLECTRCPTGTSTKGITGAVSCEPCIAGTYFDDDTGKCIPCPAGSAQRSNRSTTCEQCNSVPGVLYQDEEGQESCKKCPANTHKPLGLGGVSVKECLCSEGYWSPEGLEGVACTVCPEGAKCHASSHERRIVMPVPNRGYWTKTYTSDSHANDTSKYGENARFVAGFPFKPDEIENALSRTVVMCPVEDDCIGNSLIEQCAIDRTGPLCILCRDGYFRTGVSCIKCPGGKYSASSAIVTLIGWVIVVFIWVSMNAIAASKYECLDVALLFLQLISIVQNFNIPWPEDLKMVTQIFAILNFDVDFVSTDCLFKWDHVTSLTLTFCLPFIWALVHGFRYLLARLWLKHVGTRSIAIARILPLSIFVVSESELADMSAGINVSLVTLLVVIYNAVCVKAFQSFMCTRLSDGQEILTVAPEVICGSSTHRLLLSFSVVAIFVYVFGVPIALYHKLHALYKENMLSDPETIKRWGFLYLPFEPHYWWWPIVYLLRRFIVCLLVVVASEKPYIQVFLGVSTMILFIGLQYASCPFVMPEVDMLDSFVVVVVALYMLCGLVFLNRVEMSTEDENGFTVFLLIATASAVLFSLSIVYRQMRRALAEEKNTHHLSSFVANLWLATTMLLRANYESAEELMASIDVDGNGILTPEELEVCFANLGMTPESAQLISEILFLVIDTDRDGELTSKEIVDGLYATSDLKQSDVPFISDVVKKKIRGTEVARLMDEMMLTQTGVEAKADQIKNRLMGSSLVGISDGDFEKSTKRTEKKMSARTLAIHKNVSDGYTDSILNLRARARAMSELERRTQDVRANGGELTRTLDALKLSGWMDNRMDKPNLVMAAAVVDQWIAPHVSDHSIYGAYSYDDRAIFYRRLIAGYPAALDFLIDASEEDVIAFRNTIEKLYRTRQSHGDKGKVAKLIVQQDRAPFLHWMLYCSTQSQRKFLRKLVQDVMGFLQDDVPSFLRTPRHGDNASMTKSPFNINTKVRLANRLSTFVGARMNALASFVGVIGTPRKSQESVAAPDMNLSNLFIRAPNTPKTTLDGVDESFATTVASPKASNAAAASEDDGDGASAGLTPVATDPSSMRIDGAAPDSPFKSTHSEVNVTIVD